MRWFEFIPEKRWGVLSEAELEVLSTIEPTLHHMTAKKMIQQAVAEKKITGLEGAGIFRCWLEISRELRNPQGKGRR